MQATRRSHASFHARLSSGTETLLSLAQAHLVLEDVITVHFMEPEGSSLIFDQAAALTAASAPTSSSPSTLASSGSRTKASATSYPSHAVNAAFSVGFALVRLLWYV